MTDTYSRGGGYSQLYRDPKEGKLLGVCAGIADYFGINPWAARMAAAIGLFLFSLPTLVGYFVAGALLPRKPGQFYASHKEACFWRSVRVEPSRTARDIGHKFRDLERRLRSLEAYITSREFELNREIGNLDK